jgi:hypothetical protein
MQNALSGPYDPELAEGFLPPQKIVAFDAYHTRKRTKSNFPLGNIQLPETHVQVELPNRKLTMSKTPTFQSKDYDDSYNFNCMLYPGDQSWQQCKNLCFHCNRKYTHKNQTTRCPNCNYLFHWQCYEDHLRLCNYCEHEWHTWKPMGYKRKSKQHTAKQYE